MSKRIIVFISQLPKDEQQVWLLQLTKLLPNEKIMLAEQFNDEQKILCELAIVANPDPKVVMQFNNLCWCQSLWAGVDSLVSAFNTTELKKLKLNNAKLNKSGEFSFKISRLIDPRLAQTMSEAVLVWTLYLHRDMHNYQQQQNQAVWRQLDYRLASERTVGILGLGELGKTCALRLKENGFNVLGWSRSDKNIAGIACYSGKQGLSELAKQSDIIVCLLPLTQDTQHLINKKFLQQIPAQACLINFSRGGVVNNDDLLFFLNNRQLSHAVLDVFDQEPLTTTSVFWQHPHVTVLPHISAPTHILSASKIVANNINHYRETGQLPLCIDLAQGY